MAVKLELYRVFKEVAETGNISLAAKNLYISQSAVSQSIKQLETALQARLFARSPRGVSLTWEGQMLYQYVRSALGLLATGEDKLSQAQQLLLGTLTIGASDTVTSFFLTPYLEAFHRQHPGIRLKIVSGRSAKVLSMLKSGAVDIAFASSPTDPAALHTWSCFATHSVFVAANPHGRFIPQKSYKHTKNSMRTTVLTNRSTLFFPMQRISNSRNRKPMENSKGTW